jgi:hypothetical protein
MKQTLKKSTGPKTIPSQLTISGGVILKAMPFKIVEYHDDGTPKLFELQPAGPHDMGVDGVCVLFAQEEWIRSPQPGKAKTEPTP